MPSTGGIGRSWFGEIVVDKPPPKLATWKNWAIAVPALLAGTLWRPVKEYFATGSVSGQTLAIAGVVFCLGMAIVTVVFWHANRPEKGSKA